MPALGDIVVAARAGDRVAFSALVEREAPGAFRLAAAILRSEPEAQDAIQDAFVRAWRDLPGLRDTDRWSAWFRRIVVRSSLDRLRRTRRLREVDLGAHATASADPTDAALDRHDLWRAFTVLDAADRLILALRFGEDLTVADVADAMGVPLGTAKSRLSRATARLRAELDHA